MLQISQSAKKALTQECYRAALDALSRRSGVWKFGAQEWVPDEYEHLERVGLVRCDFGRSDGFVTSLRERAISFTQAGTDVASQLGQVRQPAYVAFSFHSALQQ